MLLFGPRSCSLASCSSSTGASNLAIALMYRCALSGGVSACHILRHRFPKIFGNLLLKQQGSGAYMPCRSWPEGSVASSAVTSPLSLGQRGKWQSGCKDHYKPLLHSGPSLNACIVQVPLPHPRGTGEELLPAALRAVPIPRAAPASISGPWMGPAQGRRSGGEHGAQQRPSISTARV